METNTSESDAVEAKAAPWWLQWAVITFAVMCAVEFVATSLFVRKVVFPDTFQLFSVILCRKLPLVGWALILYGALRRGRGVWAAFGGFMG
jgi:hypothetical protein